MFQFRKNKLDLCYEGAAAYLRTCYQRRDPAGEDPAPPEAPARRFSLSMDAAGSEEKSEAAPAREKPDVRYFKEIDPDAGPIASFSPEARMEPAFSEKLAELITDRHMTDVEVYKASGLDRRLYSRLMTGPDSHPSRDTAIMLCFGLQLTFDQAQDLISRAGYTLSRSIRRDVLLEYFLVSELWDIADINTLLLRFHEKTLGR